MWNSQRRQICADNTEDQLPSGEDSSGMMGLGKNQTLEILAQPCGLNKNLRIVYLKQVNSMACKLYLNKAVRKEKDSAQPAPTPGGSQFTEKAKERAKQKGNTKGGAQKGPFPSPPGHNSHGGQAIWPQPSFPRVSKPPG